MTTFESYKTPGTHAFLIKKYGAKWKVEGVSHFPGLFCVGFATTTQEFPCPFEKVQEICEQLKTTSGIGIHTFIFEFNPNEIYFVLWVSTPEDITKHTKLSEELMKEDRIVCACGIAYPKIHSPHEIPFDDGS